MRKNQTFILIAQRGFSKNYTYADASEPIISSNRVDGGYVVSLFGSLFVIGISSKCYEWICTKLCGQLCHGARKNSLSLYTDCPRQWVWHLTKINIPPNGFTQHRNFECLPAANWNSQNLHYRSNQMEAPESYFWSLNKY